MNNSKHEEKMFGWFSSNELLRLLVFFTLIIPDDVNRFTAIYINRTPEYVSYKWLDYSFGIIPLLIILLGMVFSIYLNKIFAWLIFVLIILREILLWLLGYCSCFSEQSYEIYLELITGVALVIITERIYPCIDNYEKFFWFTVFFNVMTVYLTFVLKPDKAGRFNAINMDAGSTGTICSLIIIYCLFNYSVKRRMLIILLSFISLLLSGSRVNLLLLVLFVLIGACVQLARKMQIGIKVSIIILLGITGVILLLVFFVYYLLGEASIDNPSISRLIGAFNYGNMKTDSSVLGRSASIGIGLRIIQDYPFGISGYFTNLQVETALRGFPTFPHSTLIDCYILFGPIVICIVIEVLKDLCTLFSRSFFYFLVLLYMSVFVTISGSPIINYKIYYFYFSIILISSKLSGDVTSKREMPLLSVNVKQ